ncbi:MAG TPA: hypothetical protein VMH24_04590 [Candidatus Sulfotelmatobacter sp.]|nr:hypothetical protein [Candidatus Sulfotelmatobacter sp.]
MLRAGGRATIVSSVPLLLGLAALIAIAVAGQDGTLLQQVADPPLAARLALGGAAAALGVVFLVGGLERLAPGAEAATLVRGVRLLFLAVGAAAGSVGWLAGLPVFLVAAAIVAGVDVVETSFLLLVTVRHGDGPRGPA